MNIFRIKNGQFLKQIKHSYSQIDNLKARGFDEISKLNLGTNRESQSPLIIARPKMINSEIITNPRIKCEIQKNRLRSIINNNNKKISMLPVNKPSITLPKKMIFTKKILDLT